MAGITEQLAKHYRECFRAHGATPRGVDWRDEPTAKVRYERMLAVIEQGSSHNPKPSVLDVGCGYGGLLEYAHMHNMQFDYTGIDVVQEMVSDAASRFPQQTFVCGDAMSHYAPGSFDYVICNGILTQKLDATIRDMEQHSKLLIQALFAIARQGLAFNLMTSHVNFTAPNLFYKSPVEMLAFCISELSTKIRLDHAYGLYEYSVYVYHDV